MMWMVAGLILQGLAQASAPPAQPPRSGKQAPARALANLGGLIGNADYPAEALRNRQEGIAGFRLFVGADGRVSGCTITQSSGHAVLDMATCRLLGERARFEPARDRRGRAIPDTVSARIVWRIEREASPTVMEPRITIVTMRASAAGDADCSATENGRQAAIPDCSKVSSDIVEVARRTGTATETTMVETITPAGRTEPADEADHGTRLLEREVVLLVAADGSIQQCRVMRYVVFASSAAKGELPEACASYPRGLSMFEPAANEGPARDVTIKTRLYARLGQRTASAGTAPSPPPPPPPPGSRPEPARARANLGALISNEDYPAEALRNHEEGTVRFRLNVGADGRVAGCAITESSGHASLDATTCRVLTERARFTPARDARGRPVPDSVQARIVWRITDDQGLMAVAPTTMVTTYRASPAGEIDCPVLLNGRAVPREPCPEVPPTMIELARRTGRTVEQTIVQIFTPGGQTEPADPGPQGSEYLSSEIILSIAADGSVLDCRAIRNEALGAAAAHPDDPPGPCEAFPQGRRFFGTAAAGSAAREMKVRTRYYMRN